MSDTPAANPFAPTHVTAICLDRADSREARRLLEADPYFAASEFVGGSAW